MKIEINIDDKLIAKIKGFFLRRNVIVLFVIIFMTSIVLYAADKKFTIFQPRTLIRSSEINDNFALMPPVGSIVAFAGPESNIPAGWLICDGRPLNKDAFEALFNAIGSSWGKKSDDEFHLPDLRGMFLRGVNGSEPTKDIEMDLNTKEQYVVDRPVDGDRAGRISLYPGGNKGDSVGSYQGDAIRNITGNMYAAQANNFTGGNGAIQTFEGGNSAAAWGSGGGNSRMNLDASRVVPAGTDNRPKNAYVYYIIRAR